MDDRRITEDNPCLVFPVTGGAFSTLFLCPLAQDNRPTDRPVTKCCSGIFIYIIIISRGLHYTYPGYKWVNHHPPTDVRKWISGHLNEESKSAHIKTAATVKIYNFYFLTPVECYCSDWCSITDISHSLPRKTTMSVFMSTDCAPVWAGSQVTGNKHVPFPVKTFRQRILRHTFGISSLGYMVTTNVKWMRVNVMTILWSMQCHLGRASFAFPMCRRRRRWMS